MIDTQLSLFDTAATESGSFYKPGDWVKIYKVPAVAKYVKCGHIYKIHGIDPIDGRLQFWNPFASQWDFLYPSEVKLALPPSDKNDSVTPVEPAVTESDSSGDGKYLALNAVSTYRPRGTARSGEYYRLSYKEGGRVKHIHIRGGNTDSPISQAKVAEVRALLAAGVSPRAIGESLTK
ncbi:MULTISPECIES: hypothetical protein [unclassified Microcoleus]|uniref:hypothetical protein n=1 Tax=unclassified Microcoleus TaxID=2642155 RepID=UPI002FD3A364